MKDFMKLERMLFNSAAYKQILTSMEMRELIQENMSSFARTVRETAPYYTQNPILRGSGQTQRWRQTINPTNKNNMWDESKAALLRALETMKAEA